MAIPTLYPPFSVGVESRPCCPSFVFKKIFDRPDCHWLIDLLFYAFRVYNPLGFLWFHAFYHPWAFLFPLVANVWAIANLQSFCFLTSTYHTNILEAPLLSHVARLKKISLFPWFDWLCWRWVFLCVVPLNDVDRWFVPFNLIEVIEPLLCDTFDKFFHLFTIVIFRKSRFYPVTSLKWYSLWCR